MAGDFLGAGEEIASGVLGCLFLTTLYTKPSHSN